MARHNGRGARKRAGAWPYVGYRLTVFSSPEEHLAEDRTLGGRVRFYPDRALQSAGARVSTGPKFESNVVVDRELVTGQNPASDGALATAFLKLLGGG
jgi:putative intracellular protease/amidase